MITNEEFDGYTELTDNETKQEMLNIELRPSETTTCCATGTCD